MKFYTKTHAHYCGIDLHARCLYVCIIDDSGQIVQHKNIKFNPDTLLKLIQPYKDNIGNPYLGWAFGETAVLFLRGNPDAKRWLEKKANQHNKAKALTILAHKLGRATYFMLKRQTLFDQNRFLNIA